MDSAPVKQITRRRGARKPSSKKKNANMGMEYGRYRGNNTRHARTPGYTSSTTGSDSFRPTMMSVASKRTTREATGATQPRHYVLAKGPDGTRGFYRRSGKLNAAAKEFVPNF